MERITLVFVKRGICCDKTLQSEFFFTKIFSSIDEIIFHSRYEALRKNRMKEIENLEKQERLLCECLGRTPKGLQECPLPSPKQLSTFENYLEELEREKLDRMETFRTKQSEIIELVAQIGIQPFLDFEKSIIEGDFLLTDSNMELLEKFHKSLKKQLADYTEEIETISKRIEQLWNILEIDVGQRDEFRTVCVGNAIDRLNILKEELKKCEILKSENMQVCFCLFIVCHLLNCLCFSVDIHRKTPERVN